MFGASCGNQLCCLAWTHVLGFGYRQSRPLQPFAKQFGSEPIAQSSNKCSHLSCKMTLPERIWCSDGSYRTSTLHGGRSPTTMTIVDVPAKARQRLPTLSRRLPSLPLRNDKSAAMFRAGSVCRKLFTRLRGPQLPTHFAV